MTEGVGKYGTGVGHTIAALFLSELTENGREMRPVGNQSASSQTNMAGADPAADVIKVMRKRIPDYGAALRPDCPLFLSPVLRRPFGQLRGGGVGVGEWGGVRYSMVSRSFFCFFVFVAFVLFIILFIYLFTFCVFHQVLLCSSCCSSDWSSCSSDSFFLF